MQLAELAARLVDAGNAEREALLRNNSALANVELAYKLKEICQADWRTKPTRSVRAAQALSFFAKFSKGHNGASEIGALAKWAGGIAALVEGQMETAVAQLDVAEATLLSLGKDYPAAGTRLAKSIGLAMLGRYDEAISCALQAREVFLAYGDLLATGQIEHNIGNLYFRRDDYRLAEKFQSDARDRFIALNNLKQLATVNNCLANTHALLHKFRSAEQLYQQAVTQAETAGVPVTQAEIEGNIGTFALLQGRYDRALDYLERSRRRYAFLGMPHQSATAEQEIADAYLELNLAPEAVAIYERIIPIFAELGMRAEQARALAHNGRAAVLLGRVSEARDLLTEARRLYAAEGNEVGEAMVALTQAQLDYHRGNYAAASLTAAAAEPRLARSGSWRKLLMARWLRGEAERALGHCSVAKTILEQTLREANQNEQPQVAERCYTSLGLVASMTGDPASAKQAFKHAVALIEELRAPLPGEETTFVARTRFVTANPTTLTPAEFVDALFQHAGVTPSAAERQAAINEFSGATTTVDAAARARVLRNVADNRAFFQQETNRAFVLMQYFGYLRRNPYDPPEPGLNFDGYNFWLSKLNKFNGDFVTADMVKAFLVSGEYRGKFAP